MNTKKSFVLDSKSLKIKEVLNQDFMEIEILSIAEGLNRNKSFFTLESMEKGIPTFYNKFIMGYYRVNNNKSGEGVFEEHNSDMKYDKELDEFYWSYTAPNAEKPLGLVRESDKVEIVEQDGKKWIRLTAVILTKYNREAVKHLLKSKGKRKVSVEITVLKSHEKDGIEIIEEFVLDAITILGNRKNSTVLCEEGIEGASMKILSFEQALQKQKEAVCFAYKELDGNLSDNEEKEKIKMDNDLENNETLIKNEKEMEGLALTYEQKRDILESVLREQKCAEESDFIWVADLSENEVFFCFNGDYYKAAYTWDETENTCIVDFDTSVRVVRDWKEYSAIEDEDIQEENETQQESFSDEENEEANAINSEEKQEFVEENESEETSNEEKFAEEDENKEEEVEEEKSEEDEDSQETNCGNFSEEETIEEEKFSDSEDDEDDVCEHCGKSKCECSLEKEEEKKEVCPECGEEKCVCSLEENKEEVEDEENKEDYQAKYEELSEKYAELQDSYSLLESQKQELDTKLEEIELAQKNAEMLTYGYEKISSENSLEDEDVESLKTSFKEACESEKFTEKEQVEKFLDVNIPKLFYERHKEEKINKSKDEDFSMQFSNPTKKANEETSIDKMRNLLKIK